MQDFFNAAITLLVVAVPVLFIISISTGKPKRKDTISDKIFFNNEEDA
jgi:hypothetical protein